MDYGALHDVGEFVANHSGWFITGGVLSGLYAWGKIYDKKDLLLKERLLNQILQMKVIQ